MSEHIQKLSIIEQNLNQIVSQKQQFNKQLLEIESAVSELNNVDQAYHIVGSVMVKKNSNDLKKDLSEKKELIKVRLESLDKQERTLRDQAQDIQEKVMSELDKQ